MNNKSKITYTFLALLLSAGVVFAHEECEKMGKDKKACPSTIQNGPMGMMPGDKKEFMACLKMDRIIKHSKEIELKEDQVTKIRELEANCKKDGIKKQAEIDTLKIDKQALVKKDNADLSELKKIIEKIAVLEGEIEYNCIENSVKIKKVLTEEQIKKLHELIKSSKGNGKKTEKEEKHEHGKQ
jgi:Spy/CpxP family protein refolding chaperone